MWMALCYTGVGFNTCWRHGKTAVGVVEDALCDGAFTPIRLQL